LKKKKTGDDSVRQITSPLSQLQGHQEDNTFVTPRTDELVDAPNTPTSRTKEDYQNSENQQPTKLISQKKVIDNSNEELQKYIKLYNEAIIEKQRLEIQLKGQNKDGLNKRNVSQPNTPPTQANLTSTAPQRDNTSTTLYFWLIIICSIFSFFIGRIFSK